MSTDVQILGSGSKQAPINYVVPSNAELLLKAVNATFTDNGASGDWLPCVTLISDSGDVIARAVDQGVKVTAGSSAEVSWFPGVKHASAAGASALAYAYAHLDETDAPQVISSGIATNVLFQHFQTSDINTFGTEVSNGLPLPGPPGNNTAGDAGLGLYKPGLYSIHLQTVWTGSGGGYYHQNRISQGFDAPGLQLDRVGTITTAATPDMLARDNQLWLRDDGMGYVTGQGALALQVYQTSGGNVNLLSGKMAAYYYGPLTSGTPGSYG